MSRATEPIRYGKLIAAAEEERFVRDKHAKNRMPYESAKFCLEQAGIKPSDVDVVAIPFAPISLFGKARKFTRVVRECGVAGARAIAIGDEARDITAARQAGIASGAVAWGYATRDLLVSCNPTHVFDTVDDVRATLLASST